MVGELFSAVQRFDLRQSQVLDKFSNMLSLALSSKNRRLFIKFNT